MKTNPRFDLAAVKLYTAFYEQRLHPECHRQCAVGTICDNSDMWKHLTDRHGSLQLSYTGLVNQKFGRKFFGYTPLELLQIEVAFLKGCGYKVPLHHKNKNPDPLDKDVLFNGMTAVIKLLCAFEGIHNTMDYIVRYLSEVNKNHPAPNV